MNYMMQYLGYVENDNFYEAIDFIVDHLDEINISIDKQMEEKQRK